MNKKFVLTAFSFIFGFVNLNAQNPTSAPSYSFTLKEAIDYGVQNHSSIKIAQYNQSKSDQKAREALSGYLPQVNVQSTFDYNYKLQQNIIPAGVFGPEEQRITFGQKYASNALIQVDQTIYDQSLIVGIKASEPNTELAKLDVQNAEETIIYNVANAYFTILVAQEQQKLLTANKTRFEELLRIIELQRKHGVVNQIDVNQVQVNLRNIESQLTIIENNIELSMNTLKNYIGIPLNSTLILKDTEKYLSQSNQTGSYNLNTEFNYEQTLAYKQQMLMLTLHDLNIKNIKYNALPKLSMYARYGANGFSQKSIIDTYDPMLDYGAIGLKLSWNIFTGFRRDSQVKSAELDREIALTNLDINRDLMNLQFKNSKLQWNRAITTIENNKRNVELAQQTYDNTNLQYKEGVASLSQLLNAELSLREANNNYTQSLIDYFKAELELNKANGTLKQYLEKL